MNELSGDWAMPRDFSVALLAIYAMPAPQPYLVLPPLWGGMRSITGLESGDGMRIGSYFREVISKKISGGPDEKIFVPT